MPEMSSGHLLDRLSIGVPRNLLFIAFRLALCSALVLKTNNEAPSNRVDLFDNVDDDGPAAVKKWSSTMYTSEFFPSTSSILQMSQPPADHFDDLQRLEPVFPHFGKRRERPVSRNTNVLQKRWGLPQSVVSKQKLRHTYDSARPLHSRQSFPLFGGFPPPPSPFHSGIDMFNSVFSPNNYYDNNVGFTHTHRPRQFVPPNAFSGPPQYANVADYDEHAPQAQNAGFTHQAPPVRVDLSPPPKSLNIPPAPPLHEQPIPPHQQVAVHNKNPLARPPVVFPTAHPGGGVNVEPLPFQVPTRPHDVDDLTRYFEVQPDTFNKQPFSSPLNANNPSIQNAQNFVNYFRPPQQKEFRLPPPAFPQHVSIQPLPATTDSANVVHAHPPSTISTSFGPPPVEQSFPVNAHPFNPPTPSLFAVPAQKPPLSFHQPQRLFVDSHKTHPVSVIGAPPTRQTIDTILHNSLPPIPPSYHPNHHEQQLINVFNPINPIANVPHPRPPPPPPPLATNFHFQLQQPRPFPFTQSTAASTTTTSTTTTSTTPQPVVSAVKYNPSSYTPPNLSKILPSDNVMFDKNGRIKKPYGPAFKTASLRKPVSVFGTEFQRVSAAVPDGSSPAAVINNIPNDQQQHGNSPNVYVTNQILYGELPSLAALGFARLSQEQQQSSTSSESTPQIVSVNYANTESTTTSIPPTTFSPRTVQVNELVASTAAPNNFNAYVPSTVTVSPLPQTNAVFFASKPQNQNEATINTVPVEQPPQNLESIGPLLQHIPDPGQHVGAVFGPPPQHHYQPPPPLQWTVKNLPPPSTNFVQPPPLPPHTEQQPILQHIPDQSVVSAPRPLPPPPNVEFYDGNVLPNDQFSSFQQPPSYNDNFNPNFSPPLQNGADFFVDNNDNFIDPTRFAPPFLGRKSSSPKSLVPNFERSRSSKFNKNLDHQYSALVNYANRLDGKNNHSKKIAYDGQWPPVNNNKSYSRRFQPTENPPTTARNTLPEVLTTISSPALPFNLYNDDDEQPKIHDQQQQSSFSKRQHLNYGYASRGFHNSVDQTRTQPKTTISTYFTPRAAEVTATTKTKQRVVFVDVNTNVVELSQNTACLDGEGIYPLPGTCARYYYCTPSTQQQTMENPLRKYRVYELVCPAGMVFDINEDGCVENSRTRQMLCKFFGASV